MSKVPLRELRLYRSLFDEADAARDPRELGLVADRTESRVEHWLLLRSLKDKLAERAGAFGVRCRDSDHCFDDLLSRVRTGRLLNPDRTETSRRLVEWALDTISSGASSGITRVETEDDRILDIVLKVQQAPKFAVRGHFWGPQDPESAWRGRIEILVVLPPRWDDTDELRSVLARTIRHELEHAHDLDGPVGLPYDGSDPVEEFGHYVLAPREVTAWSAHIADEARRENLPLDDLLEGNRCIIERGALERGATPAQAQDLAEEAEHAWRQTLTS